MLIMPPHLQEGSDGQLSRDGSEAKKSVKSTKNKKK